MPTQEKESPRIQREIKTIRAMLDIYCQAHHNQLSSLCEKCEQLEKYSITRLLNCVHKENKPTCGKCSVHCYKPSMQKQIKEVMKFSGPKMIYKHPVLAIYHLLDSFKK